MDIVLWLSELVFLFDCEITTFSPLLLGETNELCYLTVVYMFLKMFLKMFFTGYLYFAFIHLTILANILIFALVLRNFFEKLGMLTVTKI